MSKNELQDGLDKADTIDTKLDVLYDWVDMAMRMHEFGLLNECLCEVATNTLNPESGQNLDLSLGLLTASYPARSKLPGWGTLLGALKRRLPPEILTGF